ncbi:MAG: hypothetical protein QOG23_4444 [Blastocatellia bacterium]|nr:hypothetical protein [Blastocatellia bacterium]
MVKFYEMIPGTVFNGFLMFSPIKPLETVAWQFLFANHRAKAAVLMRSLRVLWPARKSARTVIVSNPNRPNTFRRESC